MIKILVHVALSLPRVDRQWAKRILAALFDTAICCYSRKNGSFAVQIGPEASDSKVDVRAVSIDASSCVHLGENLNFESGAFDPSATLPSFAR